MVTKGREGAHASRSRVIDLRVEHHRSALGIGEQAPRLSWKVLPSERPWQQTAYQVEITDPDSGEKERTPIVASAESVLVPWPATQLGSRDRRLVRVRAWSDASVTTWSSPLAIEAGLLAADDWTASLIIPDWDVDPGVDQPPFHLRRTFTVRDDPVRARLYTTIACGIRSTTSRTSSSVATTASAQSLATAGSAVTLGFAAVDAMCTVIEPVSLRSSKCNWRAVRP
jgi:alpha-L-rhamnosidase